ncbi:uncharacterized protein O3C94_011539 [Discoglossus pictus]
MYPYPDPYKPDVNGIPSYQMQNTDYSADPPPYVNGIPSYQMQNTDYSANPPSYTPYPTANETSVFPPDVPPVFMTQPIVIASPQISYRDYTRLSILTLFHCFFPIGIAALIYSCKARKSVAHGDLVEAERLSRKSFILNMVAIGVGIPFNIAWIAAVIYLKVKYSRKW